MRYALISDIHGNLPALEAVLADIDARTDVDAVFHLGDLVGYAPWPNEVVALLRERGIPGVAGNYDSTVASDYEHCGCRYEDARQEALSHESYAWTLAHVTPDTKRWLGGLPFRIDHRPLGGHASGPRLFLVHGNPVLNTVYWTEDRPDTFCSQMAAHLGARAGDVVAFGHTHKPWTREVDGIRFVNTVYWTEDRPDTFCSQMAAHLAARAGDVVAFGHTHKPWTREVDGIRFVNTGSVGRPKDGDPRAGYALVDIDASGSSAEQVRVAYDVARAAAAIRESTLPDEFATILETGGSL